MYVVVERGGTLNGIMVPEETVDDEENGEGGFIKGRDNCTRGAKLENCEEGDHPAGDEIKAGLQHTTEMFQTLKSQCAIYVATFLI